MTPAVRIVRGQPDEVEVAALVAGLAAVAAATGLPDSPDVPAAALDGSGADAERTHRARWVHGLGAGATAGGFGPRAGHTADAWRWSLRG